MAYYKRLLGKLVYLSPIDTNDTPQYTEWLNNLQTTARLGNISSIYSESLESEALERMATSGQNHAIVRQQDDKLLGNISFQDINHMHRRATIGLFIGETTERGRGYGREAMTLMLSYGFQVLNFHNVMLKVFSFNENAIGLYQSLGFKEFGRRHECYYLDGVYHDDIHMELLATDFKEKMFKLI